MCKLCKKQIKGDKYNYEDEYICRRCAEILMELENYNPALQLQPVSYHDYR